VSTHNPIPQDPSLPPVPVLAVSYPGYYCDCTRPRLDEEALRAAVWYCALCDRELRLPPEAT
jgi:hypothetical protein